MLQASVPNISSVFPYLSCKCVYLDVANVSHICLSVFCLDVAYVYNGFKCFLGVFCKCSGRIFQELHLSPHICCKCCIEMFEK
jgi:hypothetical protein